MARRRGMALVLTLWILAALVILVGAVALSVRTEMHLARMYGERESCRWAAYAGVERARVEAATLAQEPYIYFAEGAATLLSEDEAFELGEAAFVVTITDEAAKVNLNTASREVLAVLFESEEIADALIDWRDADNEAGAEGAEDEYYMGLDPPYHCKNAPFATVREVLLVKGVTEEMLTTAGEDGVTLEAMLTVYSSDVNTTADGQNRTNLATANAASLRTALGEAVTEEDINAIISRRESRAFTRVGEIALVPGITREKARDMYDRLTLSTGRTLPGLINVNTAPLKVLAALPELGAELAQAILDYREAHGPFADVGQLLDVEALPAEAFAQTADMLTARSRTFSVVSEGRMTLGGASAAVTCVLTVGDGQTAAVQYWRE